MKNYEVILYLDADIEYEIEAEDERAALNKVLDKFRGMTNEELLSYIGYYRMVREARVYDDNGHICISNEEHQI